MSRPRELRRRQCPICWQSVVQYDAPEGWLVCQPFARVAACASCISVLESRHE